MTRKTAPRDLLQVCGMLAQVLIVLSGGCSAIQGGPSEQRSSTAASAENPKNGVPIFHAEVVHTYPHDPEAFTQGLEYFGGYLYESTGKSGASTLRKVVLQTGEVVKKLSLSPQYFGEGLTIFHGKIYQLTWLSKTGFIYDLKSLHQTGEFHYDWEGWGLTHDDKSLILSDGSNKVRFIDPETFAVTRTLEVYSGNEAVVNLNELEYVNGQIFSNVWHSPRIARIDPRSGQVLAWVDLTPLVSREQRGEEDVLNGIAYDPGTHRLFVTGKNWPEIFEIKMENEPRQQ